MKFLISIGILAINLASESQEAIYSKEPWYIVQISSGPFTECTKDAGRELLENIIKDSKTEVPERKKLTLGVTTKCGEFILGQNVTCYPTPKSTAFYVWYNSKRECIEGKKGLMDSGLF
ncbi:MAG: hypothetical protein IPJ71_18340 [Bdellovibrionales bacterium]|nr:hypothetical protein [Bdellovibrionales bacterium]